MGESFDLLTILFKLHELKISTMDVFVVVYWSMRCVEAPCMVDRKQVLSVLLIRMYRKVTSTPIWDSELDALSDFLVSLSFVWTSYGPDWSWVKN
jgi:hypothetical protein